MFNFPTFYTEDVLLQITSCQFWPEEQINLLIPNDKLIEKSALCFLCFAAVHLLFETV